MAFTKLYLTTTTPVYTPATMRGAWDDTGGAVTKTLDSCPDKGGAITSVTRAETSTTDEYDVLLYRGITGPLAAQEQDVNLNVMIAVGESSSSQNAHWHLHAYTTQGDSDVVRETAIDNYREAAGTNEWPTTAVGKALNAVVSCHIHCQDGDRLVIEIGLASRNTSATSYSGSLWYGTQDASTLATAPDQAAGNSRTLYAGWISFSASVAELATTVSRATQGPVEVVYTDDTPTVYATQGIAEVVLYDDANPVRASQVLGEVIYGQTTTARVSQIVAELAVPTPVEVRVSQVVAELLLPVLVSARTTQLVSELLNAGLDEVRVSQIVVELLGKQSTYCGEPSLSPAALCGKPDVLAWLEWTVPMKES